MLSFTFKFRRPKSTWLQGPRPCPGLTYLIIRDASKKLHTNTLPPDGVSHATFKFICLRSRSLLNVKDQVGPNVACPGLNFLIIRYTSKKLHTQITIRQCVTCYFGVHVIEVKVTVRSKVKLGQVSLYPSLSFLIIRETSMKLHHRTVSHATFRFMWLKSRSLLKVKFSVIYIRFYQSSGRGICVAPTYSS